VRLPQFMVNQPVTAFSLRERGNTIRLIESNRCVSAATNSLYGLLLHDSKYESVGLTISRPNAIRGAT